MVKLLEPIFEENKIISLNRNLLTSVVDLMARFTQIFDQLEFSERSTLQNVVPSYYAMTNFVQLNGLERPEMQRTPPDKVENRPLLIYRSEYARRIEHVVLHISTCFVSLNTLIEKKLWVDYFLYVIYGHFQLDSHALL